MWTAADNKRLLTEAKRHDKNWNMISAKLFQYRHSPMACKEQYLIPTEEPWTPEDEAELLRLHAFLDPLWGTISTMLGSRHSAPSCQRKYKQMMGVNNNNPR